MVDWGIASEQVRYQHTLLTAAAQDQGTAIAQEGAVIEYTADKVVALANNLRDVNQIQESMMSTIPPTIAVLENQTIAVEKASTAQLDLAQRLADASDAMVAQAAIGQLKTALDKGEISFEDYTTAVTETQLAFGLATPESIALSEGLIKITENLGEGTLKAEDYNEALDDLIVESRAATREAKEFDAALKAIPHRKVIEVITRYRTEGNPPPGLQRGTSYFAGGMAIVGEAGPELVKGQFAETGNFKVVF